MRNARTYDQDIRDKVVNEYRETENLTEVAKRNGIPVPTVRNWIYKIKPSKSSRAEKGELARLQKELHKKEIEVAILKELLKKTNQAWLEE